MRRDECLKSALATTKNHSRDLPDAYVGAIIEAFDEAVEQGRVSPVDGVVFRKGPR